MQAFCDATGATYRHYFYGGGSGVADRLSEILQSKHGVRIAGTYSPPFHTLSKEEDDEVIARIHAAEPDLLWVGLSTPKQERWMYEHRHSLRVPVVIGVGAAFDLNSGRIRQAPKWMREHGLEWAYRLMREPRRLWRRYILYGSEFLWRVTRDLLFSGKLN
jgi:N-acetylglucosaminyldiphosphoundecaprenol N-acetyl-beta-D-mannosaminyltransferase